MASTPKREWAAEIAIAGAIVGLITFAIMPDEFRYVKDLNIILQWRGHVVLSLIGAAVIAYRSGDVPQPGQPNFLFRLVCVTAFAWVFVGVISALVIVILK